MNIHDYSDPPVRRARWVLVVWTSLATLLGTAAFAASVAGDGWSLWDLCGVGLFAVLFGWIAFGFGTATLGLASVLRDPPTPAAFPPLTPAERKTLPATAVLMPVYNESPDEVLAGVRAMLEDLRGGRGGRAVRPVPALRQHRPGGLAGRGAGLGRVAGRTAGGRAGVLPAPAAERLAQGREHRRLLLPVGGRTTR